ncbi:hypothetical protein ERICIV_03510 [Paenibacillus larvae subsp. larvae]|uniref:Uncharacterized protein n=3 Tax=Paenibacillus larvae TaxID=1464 RepID=V9WA42_9BACL|nr:hypothetical protein [Paenibacillus larvae]AHD06744.1 hypothetical protein ERIC2_c29620 [Paenibacillus larvae subsp. larvae DSM 25430]AVF27875.1 hypothetical protein ERICIII_03767 [Paenibacillus larvae subsp. larvae]AQT84232.1 hypothetical protein B1222_07205 [Paenibacillus larvae subsp. pulvifaciens]AQZ46205.1 hypothetical protein B5S25_05790 [Paenibacillus larvae subsp. pulvifaciens]ARF67542.1 hypothetical protein B7C51_06480 [Paenibacillus larvae subsp. pulvifaciens]
MSSSYCAVCNGLKQLSLSCPRCGSMTLDGGRLHDFLGPYAPYRPIEELSLTNGFPDLEQHECIHMVYCSQCRASFAYPVKEVVL